MSFRTEQEGRKGRRIQANAPAWLEAQQGRLFPCILENIGHEGAQLCVSPDVACPSRFTIRLTADGRVKRVCRVIWQRNTRIGVRFVRTDGSHYPIP
jgi:hypothetical protein